MSSRNIRGPLKYSNVTIKTTSGNVTLVNEAVLVVKKTSGAATAVTLPITTLGVTAERDLVNQFMAMPKIYDGACLAWIMLAGAATPVASPISGHLEFGWS